jgi:hypothetical protein
MSEICSKLVVFILISVIWQIFYSILGPNSPTRLPSNLPWQAPGRVEARQGGNQGLSGLWVWLSGRMCLLLQGLGGGSLWLIRDTERPRKEFYCRIDPRAPKVSGQANFWRSWINTTVKLFPGSLGRNVERFWDEVQSGKQKHVNNLAIFTMLLDVAYCFEGQGPGRVEARQGGNRG